MRAVYDHSTYASKTLSTPMPAALAHVLMLSYGFAWAFRINLIGQLYVSELIAALGIFVVRPWRPWVALPQLRAALFGLLLILCSLMISDFWNGTEPLDFLRGWANPIFAAISLIFVASILMDHIDSYASLLFGFFLAMLLFGNANYAAGIGQVSLSFDVIAQDANLFKVRFIPFMLPALMLALMLVKTRSHLLWSSLLFLCALLFLSLDARSSGIQILATSIFALIKSGVVRLSFKTTLLLILPAAIAFQTAYVIYVEYSLTFNPDGHNARQLALIENPYNPFALLQQGRSEYAAALAAIGDKPMLGHGSWAFDADAKYTLLLAERSNTLDAFFSNLSVLDGLLLIPAHSIALTSWLWGGVLGFFGFLIIFRAFYRSGVRCFLSQSSLALLCFYVFTLLLWDFAFSPFGSIRTTVASALAFLIAAERMIQDQSRHSHENQHRNHLI